MSYNNPAVELHPSPEGIDLAISDIQAKMAVLPWLEKAFGRCTLQVGRLQGNETDRRSRNEYTYPEVYNNREPYPLMMNDNLKSYCFFHAADPVTFPDYEPLQEDTLASVPLSIIFWVNLSRIAPAKNYDFSEELRADVIKVLKRCTNFVLTESLKQYDTVFRPFTITDNFRQFLKPPFAALRFNGTLTFNYNKC